MWSVGICLGGLQFNLVLFVLVVFELGLLWLCVKLSTKRILKCNLSDKIDFHSLVGKMMSLLLFFLS